MPQDSDSSDNEYSNYTTTNVLLGYASKEPTDDTFSQLGGFPTWPDLSSPPSADLAKCKTCNSMMGLLLQLNGDLPERFPGHERRLYIFSCRRKACRKKAGSIRAIRGTRAPNAPSGKPKAEDKRTMEDRAPQPPPQPSSNLGSSIFNSNFQTPTISTENPFENPFSKSTNQPRELPYFPPNKGALYSPFTPIPSNTPQSPRHQPPTPDLPTTFAQKASISSSPPPPAPQKTPWPSNSSLPPPYPSYHLDADYESLDPTPSPSTPAMDLSPDTSNGAGDEPDTFESTIDKTFQRFADRLAQNPLQVVRYEFGGAPLLYSKTDPVGKLFSAGASQPGKISTTGGAGMPRCANCGAQRVFELQLVPQAIAELEVEEEGVEGMEWGSVVVGVCGRDCGERGVEGGRMGWVEEWVGVQWEEEVGRGKGKGL